MISGMVPCKTLLQDHDINGLSNNACDDSPGKRKLVTGLQGGLLSGSSAADAILD
jgi:hypothetical protein